MGCRYLHDHKRTSGWLYEVAEAPRRWRHSEGEGRLFPLNDELGTAPRLKTEARPFGGLALGRGRAPDTLISSFALGDLIAARS